MKREKVVEIHERAAMAEEVTLPAAMLRDLCETAMTDYSRGYAAGQEEMRARAAAECYAESVRWRNEAGEHQPAQALCAVRILSLQPEGADQRGTGADVLVWRGWVVSAGYKQRRRRIKSCPWATEDGANPIYHVTHWMPCPKGPRGKP
jgi:hypothetical protein